MNAVLNNGWARGVSLLAALTLMLLITLLPQGLIAEDGSPFGHGVLMLVMWGLSAGFVHGVGFIPRNRILRILLGPVVAWLGMAVGVACYVQYFLR